MSVPKAAVHKNHDITFRKYNVGLSGQIVPMQPKSETHSMQHTPYGDFWLRVFARNSTHYF